MRCEKTSIKEDLRYYIKRALSDKTSKNKIYLGKVNSNVSLKIYDLLGIDVQQRIHILTDNDIRHILKRHGKNTEDNMVRL